MMVLISVLLLSTRLLSFSLSEDKIADEFAALEYEPKHHYYNWEDDYMHYVTCGDSTLTPLLLVHGSPGSWDNFVKLLRETSVLEDFYVVAPDRPGYGQSGLSELRDLESQSQAMQPLIESYFSQKKGVVLGHSYGGALCLQLAADYPSRFGFIISAAGTLADVYQEPKWYNYLVKYTPVGWLLDGSFDLSNREMWNLPHDLHRLYPQLEQLTTNTIILQGGKDILVNPQTAYYIQDKLPEARSQLIFSDEMDHFLIWNDLQKIEEALKMVSPSDSI